VLLYGPPGLGKTTLAHIIASEQRAALKSTSGPLIEKAGDLAALLTNLDHGDVLFIDESTGSPRSSRRSSTPPWRISGLTSSSDRAPPARSIKIDLPRFTLGRRLDADWAAHRASEGIDSASSIISAFTAGEELRQIVERSARLLQIGTDPGGAGEIARRARGTPRVANRLLRRVRDFAQVSGGLIINEGLARRNRSSACGSTSTAWTTRIDGCSSCNSLDKFEGGPVGLNTIAAALGEERDTIEEIYEPYLLQIGFLDRTPRAGASRVWRPVISGPPRPG